MTPPARVEGIKEYGSRRILALQRVSTLHPEPFLIKLINLLFLQSTAAHKLKLISYQKIKAQHHIAIFKVGFRHCYN